MNATRPAPDADTVETARPQLSDHLPDPEELPRRVLHIAALRGLGYPLRTIGRGYGVTPQAIAVMLMRHKAVLRASRSAAGLGGLSPRAVNVLGLLGIRNHAEARGVTDWEHRLHGMRNCGRKTIAEIRAWAAGGFTLVEVMAAIAMLVIMSAMILPAAGATDRRPAPGSGGLVTGGVTPATPCTGFCAR